MPTQLLKTVSGIGVISGPSQVNAGIFNLPPSFDRRLHSAHWEEEGQGVEYMQQRQPISGTRLDSDGWQVWKDPKTNQSRTVATRAGKKYILLFRSKAVQEEVNAIYGDVSKTAVYHSQTGQTIEGSTPQISGMLTEADLSKVEPSTEEIKTPEMSSKHSPVVNRLSTKQT